jgi:EmrB/QacA subfamily drug resistance transporter
MRRNLWPALVVLALAQFIVVLDVTIVNVALPSIQPDLHFSADGLQWVISAYTLLFGGFLLLGGRVADLLGARRVFITGLVLFGVTSLVAGFASDSGLLIGARAVQGLGAALLSPAALAILTVTFAPGKERNIAMGVWGGLAGLGGTVGVVAGGVLVDALSWRWVFFVNVPVVIALVAVVPLILQRIRPDREQSRVFDVPGAVLSTAGLLLIVFGVVRSESEGWGSAEVTGSLIAGVVLMIAFVAWEGRSKAPLVPLRLFRSRALSVSSVALALNGAAFLAMFFQTAVFLQQARGDSPLKAGLHFVPMGIAAIVGAVVATNLVAKIGTRTMQLIGAFLSAAGLFLLAQADAQGSYAGGILPGTFIFGFGIIWVGVPAQIAAVADVAHHEAGAVSGVVNAVFQVGGALGLAVVTTLSVSHATDAVTHGASQQAALVDGFHRGLLVAALFALVNLATVFFSPQLTPSAEEVATASAAA